MKKIILILLVIISSSVFADRNSGTVINRNSDTIIENQRVISSRAGVINTSRQLNNSDNLNNSRQKSYRSVERQANKSAVSRSAKNQVVRSLGVPQNKVKYINRQIKEQRSVKQNIKNLSTRVAVNNLNKSPVNNVVSSKQSYSVCKDTFFKCMDEFCTNKDKQLRRCSCSSRSHDFDEARSRITDVEQKMLSFNERLLSVNMEKGDAKALSKATEGETAFQKEDTSKSKKILDEISSKLKNAGSKSSFEKDMSSLSLSMDSANSFDDLDSVLGQETTLKEGVELYNSAIPVCLDIASEVCKPEDATLAEETYQMAIEKDCNTIEKTYELLNEKTISKIHEGNALLDMSRLDLYKKSNSESALLCMKKIQDAMYNKSVCGTNLELCLDSSGQYIDSKTGKFNLTIGERIVEFSTLITKPDSDDKKQSWSTFNEKNEKFYEYIHRKYDRIKSATKVCKNMAETAKTEFIEDALKKIKAKQDEKIEELKQSCTALLSECMTKSYKQIADFDKRAVSIFGVKVFRTAYEMCENARETCNALLNKDGKVSPQKENEWGDGTEKLNLEIAYQKIRSNCMEVGKQCIINQCKTDTGNFELCKDPLNSINRRSILSRNVCFNNVNDCIKDIESTIKPKDNRQTKDFINKILKYKNMDGKLGALSSLHKILYDNTDLISEDKGKDNTGEKYNTCEIDDNKRKKGLNDNCIYLYEYDENKNISVFTESLWGHCEKEENNLKNNMIRIPKDSNKETLLSWFAKQTNTDKNINSCLSSSCKNGELKAKDLKDDTDKCFSETSIYRIPININITWRRWGGEVGDYTLSIDSAKLVVSYKVDNGKQVEVYCLSDLKNNNDDLICNNWLIKVITVVGNEEKIDKVVSYNYKKTSEPGKAFSIESHQTFYINDDRKMCFWDPADRFKQSSDVGKLEYTTTTCSYSDPDIDDSNKKKIKEFPIKE